MKFFDCIFMAYTAEISDVDEHDHLDGWLLSVGI